jgi:hypothetical protein
MIADAGKSVAQHSQWVLRTDRANRGCGIVTVRMKAWCALKVRQDAPLFLSIDYQHLAPPSQLPPRSSDAAQISHQAPVPKNLNRRTGNDLIDGAATLLHSPRPQNHLNPPLRELQPPRELKRHHSRRQHGDTHEHLPCDGRPLPYGLKMHPHMGYTLQQERRR